MNYQYAKKIEKEDGLEDCVGDSHCNLVFAKGGAKGYLEAHAKAEKLIKELERHMKIITSNEINYGDCYTSERQDSEEKSLELLAQWHKENKEGE